MHKLGFGQNFIKWIRACIFEPWTAPLVNGKAVDFFKASRGLRHGCPLSPTLFVLQASVLSFHLNKKQQDQEIVGLGIARRIKCINHALFADDTLLLGVSSQLSARKFKEVMEDYFQASGSELNKGKCHVYCWNVSMAVASSIARCVGFAASASWNSFKYLRLPIFHKRATNNAYWIPGNGKHIRIWEDSIMNRPLIASSTLRRELKAWMEEVNLKSLWDILSWHGDSWVGWKTPNVPAAWLLDYTMLLQMLHGAAPIHVRRKDSRGWGAKQT
eukprot:PITA_33222